MAKLTEEHLYLTADFVDFKIKDEFKRHCFDEIRKAMPDKKLTIDDYIQDHEIKDRKLNNKEDFNRCCLDAYHLASNLEMFFKEIFIDPLDKYYSQYKMSEAIHLHYVQIINPLKNYIMSQAEQSKNDPITTEIVQSFFILFDSSFSQFKSIPPLALKTCTDQVCNWLFMLVEFSQKIYTAKLKNEHHNALLLALKDLRNPAMEIGEEVISFFSPLSVAPVCEILPCFSNPFKPMPIKLALN